MELKLSSLSFLLVTWPLNTLLIGNEERERRVPLLGGKGGSQVSLNELFLILYRDVFCAGRVVEEDLRRTMKACGGSIQTTVNNLTDDVLGSCQSFEEQQIGGER